MVVLIVPREPLLARVLPRELPVWQRGFFACGGFNGKPEGASISLEFSEKGFFTAEGILQTSGLETWD